MITHKTCRASLAAAAAAMLLISSSGCGSSGTTAATGDTAPAKEKKSGIAEQAQAAGTAAKAKPTWKEPGPAFEAKADLSGRQIAFVSVALNYQYSRALVDGVAKAAKLFGATVNATDAGGDPTAGARQIEAAVSRDAAGIVIQGFPATLLAEPIKAAKAKGIPVIMVNDAEQGDPTAAQKAVGVFANSTACFSCGGELLADLAIAKHGDKVSAVFIGTHNLGAVALAEEAGFKKELESLCPSCKAKYLDVGIEKWASDVAPSTTSALSDRTVNVVAPLYDLMDPFVLSAISAAQASDRVSVVSVDATLPGLKDVVKGAPMLGDVGDSPTWQGWIAFDQILRAHNNQPPAPDGVVPMRVFMKDNVGGLDLREKADQVAWFTDVDLQKEFSALWKR